jgi:hypothetical protein
MRGQDPPRGTISFGAFAPFLPFGSRSAEGLVDDAQELDDPSSALLGLLALRAEVFVVVTLAR